VIHIFFKFVYLTNFYIFYNFLCYILDKFDDTTYTNKVRMSGRVTTIDTARPAIVLLAFSLNRINKKKFPKPVENIGQKMSLNRLSYITESLFSIFSFYRK